MKSKLFALISVFSLISLSQAATVVVSSGLGGTNVQGVTLQIDGTVPTILNSTEYYVGVGRFVSGVFTPWAPIALDNATTGSPTREVTGSFSSSTSSTFDGLTINLFVGVLGSRPALPADLGAAFTPSGTQWTVFTSAALFPTATGTTSQTFAFSSSAVTILANGSEDNGFRGNNSASLPGTGNVTNFYGFAAPIPETSTSLLGAIGALALLRRRRN
jgi:hypothetical protein